jgi:hypothetical protein
MERNKSGIERLKTIGNAGGDAGVFVQQLGDKGDVLAVLGLPLVHLAVVIVTDPLAPFNQPRRRLLISLEKTSCRHASLSEA